MIQVLSRALVFSLLFLSAVPAVAEDHGSSDAHSGVRAVAIMRSSGQQDGKVIFRITAEVAADRETRERGLSGRGSLDENRGMLFILDAGRPAAFWMKGMRFPLDLLYFDGTGRLIKILGGLQPCTNCPVYRSPDDTAYVVEVAAGTAGKYGIRTGDYFTYAAPASGEHGQ